MDFLPHFYPIWEMFFGDNPPAIAKHFTGPKEESSRTRKVAPGT